MACANQKKSTEEKNQFVPSFGWMADSFMKSLSKEQLELFYEVMREPYMQTVGNLQEYMFNPSKRETFEAAHANGQVALMNALFDVVNAEVKSRKCK